MERSQSRRVASVMFFLLAWLIPVFGQTDPLTLPRSVRMSGLGEQGIAFGGIPEALSQNPAILSSIQDPSIHFYRHPYNALGRAYPVTAVAVGFKAGSLGSFGADYLGQEFGELRVTTAQSPDGTGETYELFQRSFSLAYAPPAGDRFAWGVQLRYAAEGLPDLDARYASKLLFSTGILTRPDGLDNRVQLGFSLTNIRLAILRKGLLPTSEQLNIGAEVTAVRHTAFQLAIHGAFTRMLGGIYPFEDRSPLYELVQWRTSPYDFVFRAGISFEWAWIDVGNDWSVLQALYLGLVDEGRQAGGRNFLTHGMKVGIQKQGFAISLGYAGRWHNIPRYPTYAFGILPSLPDESLELTLNLGPHLLGNQKAMAGDFHASTNKIILSAGVSYLLRIGRAKEHSVVWYRITTPNGGMYSLQADFYFTERLALSTNFNYLPLLIKVDLPGFGTLTEYNVETFVVGSGFRYHPIEEFLPLFMQAGFLILRANPIERTWPKYEYRSGLNIGFGWVLELPQHLVLIPGLSLTSVFNREGDTPPRLAAFNQIEFTLRFGYQVER